MTELNKVPLNAAADALTTCFRMGGKLLLCGNGGSAADCAHIAGELVKGFRKKRPLPADLQRTLETGKLQMGLPAIDLTANSALIAAVNNDQGGEFVYAQQVIAYGKPGDVLIGISTSGNAKNVCRAAKAAKALGLYVIGMTGASGGALESLSDLVLKSDETETYLVQEDHLRFYHRLCLTVEETMFSQ